MVQMESRDSHLKPWNISTSQVPLTAQETTQIQITAEVHTGAPAATAAHLLTKPTASSDAAETKPPTKGSLCQTNQSKPPTNATTTGAAPQRAHHQHQVEVEEVGTATAVALHRRIQIQPLTAQEKVQTVEEMMEEMIAEAENVTKVMLHLPLESPKLTISEDGVSMSQMRH